jgi:hypothetical protein
MDRPNDIIEYIQPAKRKKEEKHELSPRNSITTFT